MSDRETAEAISDRAADWVARIDRAGEDSGLLDELEAWLAGDERRRGAFLRAQAAWVSLDRARAFGQREATDGRRPALHRPRHAMMWGGGVAAAAAALVLVFSWPPPADRIETAVGEIRRVPLADGSMAAVNTATRISVRLDDAHREIALEDGEAWFQVAHDDRRDFIVKSGNIRVRAVGTAFAVRRVPGGASVQVTEGKVEVWRTSDMSDRQLVPAGASTFVDDAATVRPVVTADKAMERSLSWRSGQLVFSGETLGAAAAEFNRYNKVQVRIIDPELAAEQFVGRFRTNEPEAFARAAAIVHDARMRGSSSEIILAR